MAKARNLIIKSKDGNLILATGKGLVAAVNPKIKGDKTKILKLIAKRQEAGHQLTDALAQAGFEVEGRSQTDVWDPVDAVPKKSE